MPRLTPVARAPLEHATTRFATNTAAGSVGVMPWATTGQSRHHTTMVRIGADMSENQFGLARPREAAPAFGPYGEHTRSQMPMAGTEP
ncbi:unannotated protein [freshwater metagenome]|uniref:Unannotated protein n=1 Tax=freshwater metagenome TaxID=449393 RepID=A0A6J7JB80_9ZZZZ